MIKSYIYITGLMSAFMLMGWGTALWTGMVTHWVFGIGLMVFLPIYITLVIRKRKAHNERMEQIIREYNSGDHQKTLSGNKKSAKKGWSVNNSPFRDRKAGVTWGGGNIHAANASRNKRK